MENTITLRNDLLEVLEKDAMQESRTVNELVNEAVTLYLRDRHREKLQREGEAYIALHSGLKQQYLGEWVAIHEQQLVDHDTDGKALYQRVRAQYGKTAVLIRQVEEAPDSDILIRTPSTGKISG
jgi:hypothetical protein